MFIVPLLLVGLILFIVFYIGSSTNHNVNNQSKNNYPNHNNERALEILKERYAKGEINEEEYKKIKKDLEG